MHLIFTINFYVKIMINKILKGVAMKYKILVATFTAALGLQGALASDFDEQACAALKNAKIYDTKISEAIWNQSGEIGADKMSALTGGAKKTLKAAPHCIIHGEIASRTGSDGKHYGIKFELRLPGDWNGKLLFQGGGGLDGFVAPALGAVSIRTSTATPALMRGYAVVTTDSGHPTPTPEFGLEQQARLDYAYQAIDKVASVSKQLVFAAYKKAPAHSYFMGCSNGGRSALMAAQRYPLEFDGVIAANPGFRLSRAAIAEQWDNRQLMKIAPKNAAGDKIFANALTQEDLDKLSRAVLDKCDALDGLKDGIIGAWERCEFDPSGLDLPKDKISAIKAIFEGAKNSKGEQIYSGWFYDAGINQPGWRMWKLGDSQSAEPNARNIVLSKGSMNYYFLTPPQPEFDLMKFDFDKDVEQTFETAAINDAISTKLDSFRSSGGKLIIVTGVSDPVFSAMDQRDWFKKLVETNADADEFARFFALPGMNHCGGGNGIDDVDPLSALEAWREQGTAPSSLLGKSTSRAGKQIKVCAYPKVATYVGGDENNASSFECK